jgi:polar amino acid transport system substrate-binding protein
MKIPMMLVALLCRAAITFAAEPITTFHVVSPVWENYTNADGTGLYWELLRAVYAPAGLTFTTETVPYKRAQQMLVNGQADILPGISMATDTCCAFSKRILDIGMMVAFFKKATIPDWQGERSLAGKSVAWIRGYSLQQQLHVKVQIREISNEESGVAMVQQDHVDVFVDYDDNIQRIAQERHLDWNQYRMEDAIPDDLYMGFSKNDRGQQLRAIYDERIEELYQSGELQKIYAKWDYVFTPGKFEFK